MKELYSLFAEAFTLIEVFGGSYVIPLNLIDTRYKVVLVNDLDSGITDLAYCFLFLKEQLYETIESDLHVQALFNDLRLGQEKIKNDNMIANAIIKLYRIYHSVAAKGETFSYWLNVDKPNIIRLTRKKIDLINLRMRKIQIFNEDFRAFINRMMKVKSGMMYLDPPYIVAIRGKHYRLRMTKTDHYELSELLKKFNAKNMKWLLSHQKNRYIESLYSDYFINELEVPYSLAVTSKDGREREIVKELLISNYNLKTGYDKGDQQIRRLGEFLK